MGGLFGGQKEKPSNVVPAVQPESVDSSKEVELKKKMAPKTKTIYTSPLGVQEGDGATTLGG